MQDSLEELVLLAYDVPLQQGGWSAFLKALAQRTGARGACLRWMSLASPRYEMVSAGLEPRVLDEYASRFAALDVWARVQVAPGDDLFGGQMVPRRALERSEFYQDFCRPHGIGDIHKLVLARADGVQVSLALLKPPAARSDAAEQSLTRRLIPHLQRSLLLAARGAAAEEERSALSDALDLSAAGVFFLDARGRVRRCNRAAERILAQADGLRLWRGELRCAAPAVDRALHAHLAQAAPPADAHGGPLLLPRPSGRAPYRALALPAGRRAHGELEARIRTLLFVTDLHAERASPASDALLRRRFGLTAAEARVALLIGSGRSPKQAARELGVSWYTVRAQLREVFAKTGARRQAALVDLLARLRDRAELPEAAALPTTR